MQDKNIAVEVTLEKYIFGDLVWLLSYYQRLKRVYGMIYQMNVAAKVAMNE